MVRHQSVPFRNRRKREFREVRRSLLLEQRVELGDTDSVGVLAGVGVYVGARVSFRFRLAVNILFVLSLSKGHPFMVRQAHHERTTSETLENEKTLDAGGRILPAVWNLATLVQNFVGSDTVPAQYGHKTKSR